MSRAVTVSNIGSRNWNQVIAHYCCHCDVYTVRGSRPWLCSACLRQLRYNRDYALSYHVLNMEQLSTTGRLIKPREGHNENCKR